MIKDKWEIPYPDEQEIERQTTKIVQKSFPAKRSFLQELKEFQSRIGWMYLLPNRSETIFISVLLVFTIFCLGLIASVKISSAPYLYEYVFLTAPLPFLLLTFYAFYEKQEKHTFELEMTMKITIFQVIAARILAFSSISIVIHMTIAFVISLNFEAEFLRVWLISLAGLFGFAAGLLWVAARGNVWRRTLIFTGGWMVVNGVWLFSLKEAYLRFIFQLPLYVYLGVLCVIIGFFFYTFKKAFTRKQEGLWTC